MYTLEELQASSGVELYNKAKKLIPGGTQLLSKRPEMFAPDIWPSYYSKAKGSKVWDLDNRSFIDMSIMGVGACILGYSDPDIDNAVIEALHDGVSSTLNGPEEVYLAQELLDLHSWFDMARFTRSGGEAMSLAVRLARGYTEREKILFSGYHGWCDWYLAANLSNDSNLDGQLMPGLNPIGVPKSLIGTAEPFNANSILDLREKVKQSKSQIAAIVIEPARGEDAPKGYLDELKNLAKEIGAILIFDEITSGYRACPGGLHIKYGVYPDIAVFAKSMANGYAMSAILGKSDVMEIAQKTFISSTNWTDRVGPSAALATLKKYKENNVHKDIISKGKKVKQIWNDASKKYGIPISVTGLDALPSFAFKLKNSVKLETLLSVEMLRRGFLGFKQFRPSFAHTNSDIKLYKNALFEVFKIIANDISAQTLKTPPHHTGFKRLTSE